MACVSNAVPAGRYENMHYKHFDMEERPHDRITYSSSESSLEDYEEWSLGSSSTTSLGRKRSRRFNTHKLVSRLGTSLWAIASLNDPAKDKSGFLNGTNIPKIELVAYLERMVRYLNEWAKDMESEGLSIGVRSLVLSMIYIDRIMQKVPDFVLTQYNVHRVCLSAMLLATKFIEDTVFPNNFWAKVSGVNIKELNALESSFCKLIQFDLWITDIEFDRTLENFSRSSQAIIEA